MSPDLVKLAIAFLERVELKGSEVPAFVMVVNGLKSVAAAPERSAEVSDANLSVTNIEAP